MIETKEGEEEGDFAGDTSNHLLHPRRLTKPATEAEMISEAESSNSSFGSFFAGGDGSRNDVNQVAMEGIVQYSLETKVSDGRDLQTDLPIGPGSTTGGSNGGQYIAGMEEDSKSTPGEVRKPGTCSSPIRSPSRDSQG